MSKTFWPAARWMPKKREWRPQMQLSDTYIAWTAEWLWYFEDWLATGIWAGGGEHPRPRKKRWCSDEFGRENTHE